VFLFFSLSFFHFLFIVYLVYDFIINIYLAPPSEYRKVYDADKTRVIGLPCDEKVMTIR